MVKHYKLILSTRFILLCFYISSWYSNCRKRNCADKEHRETCVCVSVRAWHARACVCVMCERRAQVHTYRICSFSRLNFTRTCGDKKVQKCLPKSFREKRGKLPSRRSTYILQFGLVTTRSLVLHKWFKIDRISIEIISIVVFLRKSQAAEKFSSRNQLWKIT